MEMLIPNFNLAPSDAYSSIRNVFTDNLSTQLRSDVFRFFMSILFYVFLWLYIYTLLAIGQTARADFKFGLVRFV